MKRFMNTMFVFVALFALVFSAFSAAPAYAATDIVRPTVDSFTVGASAPDDTTAEITAFTATDAVGITGWMLTTTSAEPHPVYPSEGSWTAVASTTTLSVTPTFNFAGYDDGTYTLYPWVKDAAGNVSLFDYGDPNVTTFQTYKVDRTPTLDSVYFPMVGAYTNESPITVEVDFSEPVTGFDPAVSGDVTFTNATYVAGSLVSYGDWYIFDVTPTAAGVVTIAVPPGVATDADAHVTTGTDSDSTTYDATAPVVATFTAEATAATVAPSTDAAILTWTNTETGSGVCYWQVTGQLTSVTTAPTAPTASDLNWLGAQPATWTAPASGDYKLYPWVMDCAGNVSAVFATPATVTGFVIAGDTTAPLLNSIELHNPENDLTNADTLTFLVSFNEAMKAAQFADATIDFGVTAAPALTGTPTFAAAVYDDGTLPAGETDQWLVTVSGANLATFEGTVNLDIAGTQNLQDAAGNALVDTTAAPDETYTLDNTAPTINYVSISGGYFRINASEPLDEDSVLENVSLFTTNLTASIDESSSYCNGTTPENCYISVDYVGNGTMRLDVQPGVTDVAGNAASNVPFTLGATWTVADGAAPTVPNLSSPANNALIDTLQPKLDWSTSAQNFALAGGEWNYEVYVTVNGAPFIFNETDPDDMTFDSDPLVGLAESEYDFAAYGNTLPNNASVVWMVRSCNDNNLCSAWSKSRAFRTRLATPMQTAPANTEVLETTVPTLSWSPVSGASTYTVQLTDTGTNKVAKTLTVKAPAYTVAVIGLKPEVTYSWVVKANGKNAGLYGSAFTFKTSKAAPLAPVMTYPSNNGLIAASDEVPLSWKTVAAGKATPAAHHYEVQVSLDKNFVQNWYFEVTDDNVSDAIVDTKGLVGVYFDASRPGVTYYWRVRSWSADSATDDPIHSGWTATRAFKTKFVAPTLYMPVDGEKVTTLLPTLYWWNDDSVWTSYTVQIGTDPALKKVLKTYTVLPSSQVLTNNPLFSMKIVADPKFTLVDGTTYYWRVKINGAYSPAPSAIGSFQVDLP